MLCIHTRQRPVERYYRISGIPVHQIYRRERWRSAWRDVFSPSVYRLVRREIERFQPDLIHTHNVSGTSLAPFVASKHAGVPVVATLHDHWLLCPNNMLYQKDGSACDPTYSVTARQCGRCFREYDFWGSIPYRRRIFALLTRHVRVFLVPSHYLIEQHVRAGYARQRFQLLRLGVPLEDLQRSQVSRGLWQVLSQARRYRTLLFAGGLNIIKGAQVLIDALDEIIRRVPRFQLIVAGQALRVYAAQLNRFGRSVQMLGQVPFEEMRLLYAAVDLTAVPSTCQENFPLVAAESIARGTPVIGSAHGGTAEIVRDGKTGYLVAAGDAHALAEGVIEHFAQPAMRRRTMRQRCAKHGRELLSWERHLDGLTDVYSRVV